MSRTTYKWLAGLLFCACTSQQDEYQVPFVLSPSPDLPSIDLPDKSTKDLTSTGGAVAAGAGGTANGTPSGGASFGSGGALAIGGQVGASAAGGGSQSAGGASGSGGASFGTGGLSAQGGEGMGGEGFGGDLSGDGADGWLFDSISEIQDWSVRPPSLADQTSFDDVILWWVEGELLVDVAWPTGAPDANRGVTKFFIDANGQWDLTDQRITVVVGANDLGRGNAATFAGYDVYIVAADSNFNEFHGDGPVGEIVSPFIENAFVLDFPSNVQGEFDPADVTLLSLRVDNKWWNAGDQVFDYQNAEFFVDSLSWQLIDMPE